jgi:hypothetical protein
MALGFKTGGRVKGTPNRRTVEVIEKLESLGCDPIEGMAKLAMDPSNAPELRGRMFAELAQYIAPKRKALEVDPVEQQAPVIFQLGIGKRDDQADRKVEESVDGRGE